MKANSVPLYNKNVCQCFIRSSLYCIGCVKQLSCSTARGKKTKKSTRKAKAHKTSSPALGGKVWWQFITYNEQHPILCTSIREVNSLCVIAQISPLNHCQTIKNNEKAVFIWFTLWSCPKSFSKYWIIECPLPCNSIIYLWFFRTVSVKIKHKHWFLFTSILPSASLKRNCLRMNTVKGLIWWPQQNSVTVKHNDKVFQSVCTYSLSLLHTTACKHKTQSAGGGGKSFLKYWDSVSLFQCHFFLKKCKIMSVARFNKSWQVQTKIHYSLLRLAVNFSIQSTASKFRIMYGGKTWF